MGSITVAILKVYADMHAHFDLTVEGFYFSKHTELFFSCSIFDQVNG